MPAGTAPKMKMGPCGVRLESVNALKCTVRNHPKNKSPGGFVFATKSPETIPYYLNPTRLSTD